MKFSLAWAQTAAQNVTLKVATAILASTTCILALTTVKLSVKKPLIVERGCVSRSVEASSQDHTDLEIESFMKEALHQRFDSGATPSADYISSEEMSARVTEQKELSGRGMAQVVIVRAVKASGSTVQVDADRLISVGQIRSALPFPLTITMATTSRTNNNPYGLQVLRVAPPVQEGKK
jgi:hypothetical protein